MTEIGKLNILKVVKILDFGAYLDGAELGEILLPIKQVPKNAQVGDELEVFLYFDSEDRIIATCEEPYAYVGDFVFLEVKAVDSVGAFLDWGLYKDLLVPFREQKMDMQVGQSYIVYVYIDEKTGRIAASAKIEKYLDTNKNSYAEGQEVDLLIVDKTELGYKAIINNQDSGILYQNEVFTRIQKGDRVGGFVKKIRDDEKIDLSLYKTGFDKIDEISQKILNVLQKHKGFLRLNDKSEPGEIYNLLGISKKTFKTSIGTLYKKRIISIEKDGIRRTNSNEE
jgi:predicted RNA-binding protein (virulence factor B family)